VAESFAEFYRAEYPKLVRFVLSRGARFDDAEDVIQEVMAQALRSWETLHNPRGWARTAASRLLIRQEVKRRRQHEIARKLGRAERADAPDSAANVDRDDRSRAHRDEVELVRRVLRELPPAQREVIAYYLDGFKPDEIAGRVGKSSATVRANLREARRRLRDRFREPD
jgi:RNA polymerase sigma-70 factor (ECF subfamily)